MKYVIDRISALKEARLRQKEVGFCTGERFILSVPNMGYGSSHYEKCKNREQCVLYKKFIEEDGQSFDIDDHFRKVSARVWRKCEPFTYNAKKTDFELEWQYEKTKDLLIALCQKEEKMDHLKLQVLMKRNHIPTGYNKAMKFYDRLCDEGVLIRDTKNLGAYINKGGEK